MSPVGGRDAPQARPFMNGENNSLRNRTFSRVKDVTRKHRGARRAKKRPGGGVVGGGAVGGGVVGGGAAGGGAVGGTSPSGWAGALDARLV